MTGFWNPRQKNLVEGAFIPENKPPQPFGQAPLPCVFNYQGDAYKKISCSMAIRLDSGDETCFFDELVYPSSGKSQWQHKSLAPHNPRNAGRKPIGSEARVQTMITLDTTLKAQAKTAADDKGISLSQLVNDLLSEYLTGTDK